MFIRKKKIKSAEANKSYCVYQLVESVRTEAGPRQRILLSLGSDLALTRDEMKQLSIRIEEKTRGVMSFFSYPKKIEKLAEQFASQLINRLANVAPQEPETKTSDFQSIDLQTIEQQEPRSIGVEHLLLHLASQIGLQKHLKKLGLSERELALSLGTIIGRATFPASERATHEWLTQRSALGELIDFDFQKTSLDHLYQVSDLLWAHKSSLEKFLGESQQIFHGYTNTMLLYDLTNVYMEGQAKNNDKAKHGVSKEKRFDCPLVTLGLVINEHGFIQKSSFLPGNVSEPKTLEEAINTLSDSGDLFKPTIVMDAGIATEENLRWLRDVKKMTYIVAARQNAPSKKLEEEMVPVGNEEETGVKAALIKNDGSGERWLYCESEAKTAVAEQIKQAFRKRFEEDLQKLQAGLSKSKAQKKYGKISERIGRLKEKHSRVSSCYEITAILSENKEIVTEIKWEVKEEKLEEKLNGHYFLRTNLLNLSAKELWNLYNSIRIVEDSFRFMKSSLGIRPVYHQKGSRVDGHLWITILAYHLIRSCLYQLNKQEIFYHWPTIRNRLSSRVRVTMSAKTEKEEVLYHRSTTKAEESQREIYKALDISPQILKAKKVLV
jgi:transposase